MLEQLFSYLLIVLKKGENIENDIARLLMHTNIQLPGDSSFNRSDQRSMKGEIAHELDAIQRRLGHN